MVLLSLLLQFSHRLQGVVYLWLIVAATWLSVSVEVSALDIFVNGSRHQTLDTAWFETYGRVTGMSLTVSLLEALPLVVSCEGITVTANDQHTGEIDEIRRRPKLENLFSKGLLIDDGTGITLEWGETRIDDVIRIELTADLLESDSLTAWVSWEGIPELKDEITRFADLHGLEIGVVDTPNIRAKLITVTRARGRVPDLVMVQSDYIPELTVSGALQPVDPAAFPDLLPKAVEAMTMDSSCRAVPFYFDTQLVFINPRIIDPPEPDWTLDEMEALAESAHRKGNIPLSWNAYSAYWLVPFQMAFGKERLIDPEGFISVDDRATCEAVRYLVELKDRGLLRLLERDAMTTLFAEGRVAMILSGSYAIPGFTRIGIPFAVAPFPLLGNREDRHNSDILYHSNEREPLSPDRAVSPFLDFKGFAVTRRARNPVLARRLIQHLTSPDVQYRVTSALAKLPANEAALHRFGRSTGVSETLKISYERGIPVPAHPAYGHFKNTMWKLLRLALTDGAKIDEVLEKGQILLENASRRER
jgi:ABC-type glycerol-3-phosphate transport system substrate-binding protein